VSCNTQNISCAHLNISLLLPLFITCPAACEQQSVGRDRATLLSIVNVGRRISFVTTTHWCRDSIGDGCINTTLSQSSVVLHLSQWSICLTGCLRCGRSTSACLRLSGHQVRKRRSSRHRRRKQQSTSSVYHSPSDLSANRRRAVDDKEGHLIYQDGDILHSRCILAFVYLLSRR